MSSSSSSSSGPIYLEIPYDPWGNVGAGGSQVGPVYGSPPSESGCAECCEGEADGCSIFDDPFYCGECNWYDNAYACPDQDPCETHNSSSVCYEVFNAETMEYEYPNAGMYSPTQPANNSSSNQVDNPRRPANTNVPNNLDRQVARVREGMGQLYMVEEDLMRLSRTQGKQRTNPFAWGQTRSYANIEGPDEGGVNGNRWLNKELGYLDFQGATPGIGLPGRVVRRGLANEALFFEYDAVEDVYTKLGAFYGELSHDQNNCFELSNESGYTWIYYDNSLSHPAELRGKLKSIRSPYGETTQLVYNANSELQSVTFQWADEQFEENVIDTFLYEYYDTLEHIGLLKSVTYRSNGSNYRKVDYEYYSDGDTHGAGGDLKRAVVSEAIVLNSFRATPTDQQAWFQLHENYYRYYTANGSGGVEHGVHIVLRGEACQKLRQAGHDPESATEAVMKTFSDYVFAYDSDRRVVVQHVRGNTETFTYAYDSNTDDPGIGDKNTWGTRTTVTNPDGTERRVYTNPTDSVLVSCFEDTGSNVAVDAVERNNDGWSQQHAFPDAVSSVTEPSGGSNTLTVNYNANSGIIYRFDHYTTTDPNTGAVAGRPKGVSVQEGISGTPEPVDGTTWRQETVGDVTVCPVWKQEKYPEGSGGAAVAWETENVYYQDENGNDTLQIKQQTVKLPIIPVAQNGDGQQYTKVSVFDRQGKRTWYKNARGFITHWQFRSDGVVSRRIDDVDTNQVDNVPDGWTTPAGGGLNLITDIESDVTGRPVRELGPWREAVLGERDTSPTMVRPVKFTVYRPDLDEIRTATGYATGESPAYAFETVGEVTIRRYDKNGKETEKIMAVRECTCGTLNANEEYPQSSWESWTKNFYDEFGRLLVQRKYHDIPRIGEGERGDDYGETRWGYDQMGRLVRQVTPGGTISRIVHDSRGLVVSRWTGTNDTGATATDPTGGGASGNNMVKVTEYEYDNGNFDGNGLVTKETRPVDGNSANDRVTEYEYDFRTNLVQETRKAGTGGNDLITHYTRDNYGHATQTDSYHTSVAAGNLTARRKAYFDSMGRTYQSETYAVDPSNGTVGNAMRSETWRNANGNPVKQLGQGSEAFTKTTYDGLDRTTAQYFAYNAGTSTNDGDPSGDVVVEQVEFELGPTNLRTLSKNFQRFHDATGNGPLNGPDGDQPKARRSYVANYFDGAGRQLAQANYGTNGGAVLERPATVPRRSDTVLVTSYRYLTDGEADAVIDPMGLETRWEKDALGRRVILIENFDAEAPSGDYSSNRTTGYAYTLDGNLKTLTLVNAVTGDQTTRFVYGTTLSDSGVARADLLRAKIYPESGDDHDPLGDGPDGEFNRIEYEYDRQGSSTKMTDPNGTVHEYDYDKLGRQIHDRATTIASGINSAVERISTVYDDQERVFTVTSWDDADPASGTVVNQVEYGYGGFGQLVVDKQAHDGAVDGSTPAVSYAYEDGSSGNTSRRTSVTYPDGRIVEYGYGAANGEDDLLSRVATVKINGESDNLAEYTYLGQGSVVEVSHPQPGIDLTYLGGAGQAVGDAGDPYVGYDRFGRVVDMRWTTSGDVVRDGFQYGYDRDSRRTWRSNLAASSGDGQQEAYAYDGLGQVTGAARGDLNLSRTAVAGIPAHDEAFGYDPTGNWLSYTERTDGVEDLDQTRVNNKDNQVTQFDGSSVGVEYDKAGNATEMPTSDWDHDIYRELTWDAWNRLVSVQEWDHDQVEILGNYEYDGTTRRTKVSTLPPGGEVIRHVFYDNQWKSIEERLDASTDPERQFVWSARNRNNAILRDRDTNGDGTLDERLWPTCDAMGSVTSVLDTSGEVDERYDYTAFGVRKVTAADFTARTASDFDWMLSFHGEFLDELTGYQNYGFRYYDPETGRWGSRDPAGERAGVNLYNFVSNNAVSISDQLGLSQSSGNTKLDVVRIRDKVPHVWVGAIGNSIGDYVIEIEYGCNKVPEVTDFYIDGQVGIGVTRSFDAANLINLQRSVVLDCQLDPVTGCYMEVFRYTATLRARWSVSFGVTLGQGVSTGGSGVDPHIETRDYESLLLICACSPGG